MIQIGVLHNYFTLDCIAHIIYLQVNSGRWRLSQGEEVREKEKERDIAYHLTGVNQQVCFNSYLTIGNCKVCTLPQCLANVSAGKGALQHLKVSGGRCKSS